MKNDHDADETPTRQGHDDESMRLLVTRLARPHRSGGRVVERASLLASGADFAAAMAWLEAHGGQPEALPTTSAASRRGLHSARLNARDENATPLRFILPAAALG